MAINPIGLLHTLHTIFSQNPFTEMTSPGIHVIIFLLHLTTIISAVTTSDLTTLIYKGCANQNFENPIASQNLQSLYTTLVSQSSTTNYFKTTTGENDQNTPTIPTTTTTITGLYQCRGDLSNSDCNTCVKKLPNTIQKVCDTNTIAARAQLVGCYMRYEVFGFQQYPATELLYKKCGSGSDEENGSGYDERLETALSMIPKGVSNGKGYYAGGYENVFVLGQCEGDLVGGECVNCLKTAVDVSRRECRSSVSGQVFLHRCYISYTYYPNGVPNAGGADGAVSGVATGGAKIGGGGTGGNRKTEKAVAIVFGGLAGVGLVVALLLVLKSACKKKKEHHTYTYSYGNNNANHNNNNGHGNNSGYNYGYGYGNGNGHGQIM